MNEDQYIQIVRTYLDRLFRLALSHTGNRADAEDAVQNTFIKLSRYKEPFESEEHIRNWLFKVCVRECRSIWRTFWKQNVDFFEDEEICHPANPESKDLLYKIMLLNKNYRTILVLFYYEGFSTQEIADLLGISLTNATSRLSRARQKLKKILEDDEQWMNDNIGMKSRKV